MFEKSGDIGKIIELLNPGKITLLIISIIILFFLLKRINTWAISLYDRFPARRLFLTQVFTILSFCISIFGFIGIIYWTLSPSKEILLAIGGSLAVAIGFSLKDIVSSLVAGIILLFDRPFQVGDKVAFGDTYGEIQRIGLRAIRLVTLDDNLVTIPNSRFMTDVVASANAGQLDMMVEMPFHISAHEDIKKVENILYEITVSSPYVYLKKPVNIVIQESLERLGLSTKLVIKAYVLDIKYEKKFSSDIYRRAISYFQKEGIKRFQTDFIFQGQ